MICAMCGWMGEGWICSKCGVAAMVEDDIVEDNRTNERDEELKQERIDRET